MVIFLARAGNDENGGGSVEELHMQITRAVYLGEEIRYFTDALRFRRYKDPDDDGIGSGITGRRRGRI